MVTYKDLMKLPENLQILLPTSFDIIGDIALIKLPTELLKFKITIGEALLATNKNIHVVCLDQGVTGEMRVRKIEIIAGEQRTLTTHREYGSEFVVDVSKTYFSPRLANERKRVVEQVTSDETVIDMFAGVAPFSIMIAKHAHPQLVYAVDKNKDAVLLAKQNVARNNVLDKIEVIHGDAHDIVKHLHHKGVVANRILMNLPFDAYRFFEDALAIITDGGIIHYYDVQEENNINNRIKLLQNKAYKSKTFLEIQNIQRIKTYSPREIYIGIDIEVKLT